jgi:hypothetical protein
VDDSQRDRILAAKEEWREAEWAYNDKLMRYVSVGWVLDGPLPPPEKALHQDGYQELMQLRQSAEDARAAYEEVLGGASSW